MKNTKQCILGTVLIVFMVMMPWLAQATEVAIVDIQRIMKEATVVKDIQGQIDKKKQEYQASITEKENTLKEVDKELASQRAILSPEAFESQRKEFIDKVAKAQKEVQDKTATLERSYTAALGDVQQSLNEVVGKLAGEKNFDLVIPSSQLIYAKGSLDITSEVLKRLNKKLPKMKVKILEK